MAAPSFVVAHESCAMTSAQLRFPEWQREYEAAIFEISPVFRIILGQGLGALGEAIRCSADVKGRLAYYVTASYAAAIVPLIITFVKAS
jgi:hypothetical protein